MINLVTCGFCSFLLKSIISSENSFKVCPSRFQIGYFPLYLSDRNLYIILPRFMIFYYLWSLLSHSFNFSLLVLYVPLNPLVSNSPFSFNDQIFFFFQGKSTHFNTNVCSTMTPIEVSLQLQVCVFKQMFIICTKLNLTIVYPVLIVFYILNSQSTLCIKANKLHRNLV